MYLPELLRVRQLGSRLDRRGGRRAKHRQTGWRSLRVESLEDRTMLDAVRWINTAGGDWAVAANWSPHAPRLADDVTIDLPGNITITHSSGTDAIHSLTSTKALDISGGSLTISAPASVAAVTIRNHAQLATVATTWSNVTVDNATLTTDGRQDMNSLSIVHGGLLTQAPNTTTTTHLVDLHVTGTVQVDANSRIDVSGRGYLAGRTKGNTTSGGATGSSGGSYGGLGGAREAASTGASNAAYDDYANPNEWGSGGATGSYGSGGAGGGLVRLSATTLALDGQMLANGVDGRETCNDYGCFGSGAGSGGGIYVAVSTLSGRGAIQAAGGGIRAAGGGGRIAIYATATGSFDLSKVQALGGASGTVGGAGTVYLKRPGDAQGTLIVDAGTGGSGVTPLGLPGQTNVTIADAVIVRGNRTYVRPEHASMSFNLQGGVTVRDGGYAEFDTVSVAATLTVQGATLQVSGTLAASVPVTVDGSTLRGTRVMAPALALVHGGLATTFGATTSQAYRLELTIAGTLSVDSTSRIDVSGEGYLAGRTKGNTTAGGATGSSGGSYGGLGGAREGASNGSSNVAYDDYANPAEWGSGGASGTYGSGGAGGGLVRLSATTLALDGQVLANGVDGRETCNDYGCFGSGAGSGGGIYVAVSTLSGQGRIQATGGGVRGAGGGGRIAVYAAATGGFNLSKVQALGGASGTVGGAGTVYLKRPGDAQGTLIVDAGTGGNGWTPLGLPGQTNVTIADAVLIRGSHTQVRPEHAGMSFALQGGVTVRDASYAEFDTVGVAGTLMVLGATLQVSGTLAASVPVTVDGGTLRGTRVMAPALTLVHASLVTTFGATTSQVSRLELTIAGTLSVDGTSRIDVSGEGYLAGRTKGNTTSGGATGSSGGSYGGLGGSVDGSSSVAYDDYANPAEWGSGGATGAYGSGGAGGGLVRLSAATLALDGQVLANGVDGRETCNDYGCFGSGAGSGGGIYVAVSTLSGQGRIQAAGGGVRGGGGGGRIAVYAAATGGFDLSKVQALGGASGTVGGAGMVYLKRPADAQGTLIVDAGMGGSGVTPLGLPGQTSVTIPDAVIVRGSHTHVRPEHAGMSFALQGGVTVRDAGYAEFDTVGVAGALMVQGATLQVSGTLAASVPVTVDGGTLRGTRVMAPALTLVHASLVTTFGATTSQVSRLELTIAGTLSVDSTSRIDVSGEGYLAGRTKGNTTMGGATGSSGGSYGGLGGAVDGSSSVAYDDYTNPNEWGSGGASGTYGSGGAGGGLVRLGATTLALDGQVLANGNDGRQTCNDYGCFGSGAGSGGGIYVAVSTLSGQGRIQAVGGGIRGAGGGGRIAVYAAATGGFDLSKVQALGGASGTAGGAGTVYLKRPGDAQGTLIVDAGMGGSGVTPLGLPGQATVTIPDAVIIRGDRTTASVDNAVALWATVTLEGGSLRGAGDLTLNGSITLNGGGINVAGNLTIGRTGTLTVTGPSEKSLSTRSLTNAGLLQVLSSLLTVNPSGANPTFTNTGIIDVQTGSLAISAGGLRNDGSGIVRSNLSATISIRGDLVGNSHNADQFAPQGSVTLSGPGTAQSPQQLEVMGQDRGNVSQGFTRNFAYGTLTLGGNTYVQLVNHSGGTRVLYVNSVIVPSGSTLDLNGFHLYARVIQKNGTIVGGTVNQPPPGPLALGFPAGGFIANDPQVDEWTFFGRSGQTVSVIVNTNPGLNFGHVRIFDPNNRVVGDQTNSQSGADVSFLGLPLPLDGTYRVQVSAGHAGSRGNYILAVWDATITNSPLNLNQTIAGQIDTPYRVDRWNFAAAMNTPIQFVLVNVSRTGLQFDLAGPNGYTHPMLHNGDLVTLPSGGSYVLSVAGVRQQTGAYSFRVQQTTVTDLTLGTTFTGTFAGSGQAQLFRVNVPQAKQMLVVLRDSNNADHNELYLRFGSAPTRADYDYRFSTPAAANQQILTPTAAPGTWYILAYGELEQLPNHFTLQVATSTVFITGVTPDHAANTANATLTLTGSGFNRHTVISLVAGNGTVYPAATTSIDLPTQITATFSAGTVPAGVYTLRAAQAGGDTFNLPNAFTMIAGGQPHLSTDVVLPGALGNHIAATLYVDYSNTGNVAMPAPLLVLTGTRNGRPGALLTLDASRVVSGFWTSAIPDGYSTSVQILASGATPGILQPGESVRVPVYYGGWQQPWVGSELVFTISVLQPDNAVAVDWSSLKDSLRPPSINARAWDPIFTNLVGALGHTWGGYVQMLDTNAAYLGRLGEKVTDVSQLWTFQVQQAIGLSTVSTLGAAVDVQVAQPGLPLTLGRFFTPSLIGRNQLGVLGWGWTWEGGWQQTLSVASDGTVTIADADGSQRRFQPDSRGGYFAQAGDTGTLRNLGGGVYSLQELNGLTTRFRADGKIDLVADPNNNRISAGYTGGLLTSLTHSAGQALQIHYNAAGRIDKVTDSANRATTFSYDATNEYLLSVQTFDGLITRYTYNQGSDVRQKHALLSIESPGGTHQFFGYNSQGFLDDVSKDGNAEEIQFAYGPAGLVTTTDAAMNTTQTFFNDKGLPAKVVDPQQNATELSYDTMFDLTQVVDPTGQQYRYQYDGMGNVIRSTDPLGNTVSFVYGGPYNRLTLVTDARGYQTRYGYDPQGNLLSITYADNSSEQFVPNAAGDPIQWTNARGTPIKYERDSAGRVRKATYADGSHVDYNYDPARGTLLSATDASGTTMLLYQDAQHPDRVTKIVYPGGRSLAYQYDAAGRRSQMTDQGGFTVKYHFDAVGRLDKLLDGTDKPIVQYTYDPTGLLKRTDNGNGTYTTYDYTPAGQVKTLINYAPNGSVNSRFAYTYDDLNRVATMTTLEGVWTYGYDGIGRLTSAQLPNGRKIQYQYDANGNRMAVSDNGTTTAYTSNNRNQYVTVGGVTYGYDADGNMISKQDNSGLTTYTYDDQNRLTKVTGPDGTWTYEYDVFGNRRATTHNGQRTEYLLDPSGLGDVVGEYNGASLIAHYTYGLGLTSRVDSAGAASYYDFDALGATVGMTGQAGSYVNRYSYLPFGQPLSSAETVANPFAFDGRWGVMTQGDGLDFMRARFYASSLGRFLSTDPLLGELHSYVYAANNPVSFIDPSGLKSSIEDLADTYDKLRCPTIGGKAQICVDPNPFNPSFEIRFPPKPPAPPEHNLPLPLPDPPAPNLPMPHPCADPLSLPSYTCLPKPPPRNPWFPPQTQPPPTCQGHSTGPGFCAPAGGGTSRSASSMDPNDKLGPAGFGSANFVSINQALAYRIDFENDATATAPAQRVDVTDQLAATLDWNTFQITEIGFGDTLLTIPPGTQHYQTTVAMTYNGKTFNVLIEVGLRAQTGQVFAIFQSIDPATSLPPDVLTGFLPPENGSGRGQGHISYTIRPKAGLATGTQIRNVALVTFDRGETIATDQVDDHDPTKGTDPTKEALVTIDAVPPTSKVSPLPALTRTPGFLVQWSGQDDMGGSGLAFFDIYVSDNGGPFVPWLTRTTLTQAMFTGQDGHTYGFYSVATDNAGNREADPAAAQATTKLYTADHFSVLAMPNPAAAGVAFQLTVRALDVNGNPATAYTGTVHLSSSIGADQLPADYTFLPGENGVHVFTITLTLAGTRTITVRDTATATIAGMVSVQVNPAAARSFVVAGFPTPVVAGTPGGFTVTALDPYGNVATGYRGTVHFASTDPQAMLPADYTFAAADAGVHTFSGIILKTAGSRSITATDTVTMSLTGTQSGIMVTAAAADHFRLEAPHHRRAGHAFSLTITALDPYGNVDVNYAGTVTFASSDDQASLPDDYIFTTDDAGVHTFDGIILVTAGQQSLTATDVDTAITGSGTLRVTPAHADHFLITAPGKVPAGIAFGVTVTALDPFGNIATHYHGTITFTTGDPDARVILPDDYTFTDQDEGVHTFADSLVLWTRGEQVIAVADVGGDILGSATIRVKVPRDNASGTSRAPQQRQDLDLRGLAVADRSPRWVEPIVEWSGVMPGQGPILASQPPLRPDCLDQFYTTTPGGNGQPHRLLVLSPARRATVDEWLGHAEKEDGMIRWPMD